MSAFPLALKPVGAATPGCPVAFVARRFRSPGGREERGHVGVQILEKTSHALHQAHANPAHLKVLDAGHQAMGAKQHRLRLVASLMRELVPAAPGELVERCGFLHEKHHERVHVGVLGSDTGVSSMPRERRTARAWSSFSFEAASFVRSSENASAR